MENTAIVWKNHPIDDLCFIEKYKYHLLQAVKIVFGKMSSPYNIFFSP